MKATKTTSLKDWRRWHNITGLKPTMNRSMHLKIGMRRSGTSLHRNKATKKLMSGIKKFKKGQKRNGMSGLSSGAMNTIISMRRNKNCTVSIKTSVKMNQITKN